jgi:hypothetical protein
MVERITRKQAEMSRLAGTAQFLLRITEPGDALSPLVSRYEDAISQMSNVALILTQIRGLVARKWTDRGPRGKEDHAEDV